MVAEPPARQGRSTTPVGDDRRVSAERERSPARPGRQASRSPQGGAQADVTRGPSGSAGQQIGGSGGGTSTDLMVRPLEKVMQQLQGMSAQFGELRLTNERQQRQLDGLLTGFRGLEQRVNVNQGVGGQGREAQGASPSRPQGREAQGASPGVPAWGSPNLPDPWRAASEAARPQGVGFTTYSDLTAQKGLYEEGFGATTNSGPSGQSGPNRVFRSSEGLDTPPGIPPQEGPFAEREGANWGDNWTSGQGGAWQNWNPWHGYQGGNGRTQDAKDADIFQRSERWMPSPPTPDHRSWQTRLQEVTGFLEYTNRLVAWVGLGHDQFPREISLAVKETTPLVMERLTEG